MLSVKEAKAHRSRDAEAENGEQESDAVRHGAAGCLVSPQRKWSTTRGKREVIRGI